MYSHNVTIRAKCKIAYRVVILHGSTLEGKIKIGKGVKIMAHENISSETHIGSMTFIGPKVNILNAKLPMRDSAISRVTIGDNVFVAVGATVLKYIPSNSFTYGTPDKFGKRNNPEQIFIGLDLWDDSRDDETWENEKFLDRDG